MSIDPLKYFAINGDNCPLLSVPFVGSVANNIEAIAAATGYRFRVMGWIVQAPGAAAGSYRFKSASGGTTLCPLYWGPPAASPPDVFELDDGGYFETNTSEGLFIDMGTNASNLLIRYIKYKPA